SKHDDCPEMTHCRHSLLTRSRCPPSRPKERTTCFPLPQRQPVPLISCLSSRGQGMRRRNFLSVAAGTVATWPYCARADRMPRVAILTPSQTQWQPRTFRDALSELGYREGVNLVIEVISSENQLERLPRLATELVSRAPDVIVAVNTPSTRAAIA